MTAGVQHAFVSLVKNRSFVLMLKKTAILLLCLLYTVSVYGVVFNVRYCGSEVVFEQSGKPGIMCPVCHSAARAMKCCKTGKVEVKVKDAHLAGTGYIFAKAFAFTLPRLNANGFTLAWQQVLTEKVLLYGPHAPPPGSSGLILIKNCTFRI